MLIYFVKSIKNYFNVNINTLYAIFKKNINCKYCYIIY